MSVSWWGPHETMPANDGGHTQPVAGYTQPMSAGPSQGGAAGHTFPMPFQDGGVVRYQEGQSPWSGEASHGPLVDVRSPAPRQAATRQSPISASPSAAALHLSAEQVRRLILDNPGAHIEVDVNWYSATQNAYDLDFLELTVDSADGAVLRATDAAGAAFAVEFLEDEARAATGKVAVYVSTGEGETERVGNGAVTRVQAGGMTWPESEARRVL